jgi:hypothetical protein
MSPTILQPPRPLATHLMRRTDYLPAIRRGRPLWIAVCRSRRVPRDGQHWIMTNRRTGETLYAVAARSTPEHWHMNLCRSADNPAAMTRLARSTWQPTWLVRYIALSDEATRRYDAMAATRAKSEESFALPAAGAV